MRTPYVMFLDSDDVLPPGAVDALLAAATRADAQVAGGLCVRRELPSGREVPWEPALYASPAVLAHPADRPRLVRDTLSVDKLYATAFLRDHGIRFPDGRFPYEDFVFTARVWAAGPRVALVPDRVYVWHVRRSAPRLSISLDRADAANWRARTHACRTVHAILLDAGEKRLARAARAKFLDHDLRMYARELPLRDETYRREWWAHTRGHLAEYDAADLARDPAAPGTLIARVLLASPAPCDLPRLRELAARPARLCPPYARAGTARRAGRRTCPGSVWSPCRPAPPGCCRSPSTRNCARVPACCGCACTSCTGAVGRAGPVEVEVEWRHRDRPGTALRRTLPLRPSSGTLWAALVPVPFDRLAALATGAWDLRLRLRFRSGAVRTVSAHALTGPGLLRPRGRAEPPVRGGPDPPLRHARGRARPPGDGRRPGHRPGPTRPPATPAAGRG